ncbi:5'/3'-nucleotidase SurE [Streptomyces sp. ISL-22]|uniref:5'/3'-nucleotidase SurE n=1 Tax=unclassified Streptomyces TaxID=2593676 RepID=UPI001BEA0C45|nr:MULTISPECIES: 5'/3'-nucleotidase SurE [unclassified Streptomyces]MBT2422479.1 5'/3'-nucleotidase SurE [Streptomyces sp. ISL-24]MBT2436530.1 5'/3'-nucleotidase SurE [Streptomyces sp. ISL-22]
MRRTRVLPLTTLLLCTPALVGTVSASAAPKTAPDGPLRILLTNDDGYDAPGIRMLYQRLTAAGHDVTIVAPLTNQSGTGTKMMSGTTVTVKHPEPRVWAVDGTPGDSVSFGLSEVFANHAPDLVVSGTNFGPNVAALATHSGTVGGAVAALEHGVPAIAVSTGGLTVPVPEPIFNAMRPTNDFTVKVIERLQAQANNGRLLPEGVGLNINHPVVGPDGKGTASGASLTEQDPQPVLKADYTDSGDGTWKVNVRVVSAPAQKGGDVEAIRADKVSITPISPNWNTGTVDFAKTAKLLAGLRP